MTVISAWNEANHRSQPTFKNPKRAAQFYNVVRANCRRCKIIAADVIDETNMERWLQVFKRYAKRPKIWGLHNYRDTNPRPGQKFGGTARLLRAVRGEVAHGDRRDREVRAAECGTLFRFDEARANRATKRMFETAKRYRRRIKRLYIYQWQQPAGVNRFDALDRGGRRATARLLHCAALQTRTFNRSRPARLPSRAAPPGAAVLRHRCAAGPGGAARGSVVRRRGHGAAAGQGGARPELVRAAGVFRRACSSMARCSG